MTKLSESTATEKAGRQREVSSLRPQPKVHSRPRRTAEFWIFHGRSADGENVRIGHFGGRGGFELSVRDGFKLEAISSVMAVSANGSRDAAANRLTGRVFGGVPLGIGEGFEMLAFATTILRESLHLGV